MNRVDLQGPGTSAGPRPTRKRQEELMSVIPRLNRLFKEDGKCFQIAVDHGLFNGYELQHVVPPEHI